MQYTYPMSTYRISVAPVKELAKKRGYTSIRSFSRAASVPYGTAYRWWQDSVTQIHADTLAQIAEFFDVEPGDLLRKVPRDA